MPSKPEARSMKLSKAHIWALRWARRKYTDGRVPPYVFRDYRTPRKLLDAGFIEWWVGYGGPMYRFTQQGLDALEKCDANTRRSL